MSEPPPSDLSALRIDRSGGQRKPRRRWLGRVILLLFVGAGLWLFERPLTELMDRVRLPEVEVVPLVVTSPSSASGAQGAAANGYIVARTRAALSAERPGRIVEINVVEGSFVKRGDVVARLDATEQEAALVRARAEVDVARASLARSVGDLEQARANLVQAGSGVPTAQAQLDTSKATLEFASRERVRFEKLVDQGFSEERRRDEVLRDLAQAKAGLHGAEAALEAAKAAVEVAKRAVASAELVQAEATARLASTSALVTGFEASLEKTFVRAPFDGVIVLKEAEVGEVVSPNSQGGSTARGSVATMVDFKSLEVQAEVPETTLSAVHLGGAARVYLDAFPGEPYAARIDRIWPTADRSKATVEVRIALEQSVLEQPDERLRPDMGVRVVFLDSEPDEDLAPEEPVLLMPTGALVTIGGEQGVFVLERDRLRFQPVRIGEARSGRHVVKSGLKGDERVVTGPAANLEDGMRVRLKP